MKRFFSKKGVAALITAGIMLVSALSPVAVFANQDLGVPLYRHFEDYFLVGNIWSSGWRGPMNQEAQDFLRHHFNAVTAEDYHKPDQIVPSGARFRDFAHVNEWNWERSERILDFAEANDMAMIGHTLVWHGQSPLWLTGSPGHTTLPLVDRQQAIYNLGRFINEIAGRWEGRIFSWDVVNEVFTTSVSQGAWNANPNWRAHLRRDGVDLGNNDLRWYDAFANGATGNECGSDFIYYAFRFTRLADSNALLYYNDFNEESPGKREAIAQMVEELNDRWTRDPLYDGRLLIDVIGMQSHYHLDQWSTNFDNVRPTIERFIATGARISITELDITIGTQANQLAAPLTEAQQQRQAAAFERLFGYYLEYHQHINRVSIWGMADNRSWRGWGQPTLNSADFGPKAAFDAVLAMGRVPTTVTTPAAVVATPVEVPTEEPATAVQAVPLPATIERIIRFAIGNPVYTVQGVPQTSDAAPFIDPETNRTMLPLRVVSTAMGAEVSWDAANRNAIVVLGDIEIVMSVDEALPDGMGSPMIVDDRVFVPARYVVEMLGAGVEWDGVAQAVYIRA